MKCNVIFKENAQRLNASFGEIQEVTDGGFDKGYSDGYDKGNQDGYGIGFNSGINEGKKLENEKFWQDFTTQLNTRGEKVERNTYSYAFAYWLPDAFTLSKTIKPQNAARMFMSFNEYGEPFDLASRLKELGIELDFSTCTDIQYAFANARISNVPLLNLTATGLKAITALLNNSVVETVEKIILKNDGSQTFATNTFNTSTLKNIKFGGVIGTDIWFTWCYELSKESIANIIETLSTTASGKNITFSLQAVNKAFETSEGANDGSSSTEWQTLADSKQNWTINLS